MSSNFKSILQLSILLLCIFSINFISQSKDEKVGDIHKTYSIALNGDGVKEQILLKIYKVNQNGDWYAKLVVVNKDGKIIWESPESDDIDSPMVFGAWGMGIGLPEIVDDIDKDGFIEVVRQAPQSDVRPATFQVLRWKNNKFSLVKGGMLLDNLCGSGNYCWSVNYDYNLLIKQKQRWIMQFTSSSDGKYTVRIYDHTSSNCTGSDFEIGEALVTGDENGFHISKWIKPIAPKESTPSEKTGEQLLVDLLDKHYTAINNKNFKDAYNCRSNEWRTIHSYDEFYGNWESNIAIKLTKIEILSRTEEKAEVKIELYSRDSNGNGDKKAHYNGTVYLIKEKGEWKINDVQVKEKK